MRKNNLFKKTVAAGLVLLMTASLAACNGKKTDTKTEDKKTETKAGKEEDVELQVFIAASLNTAMTDIAERYEKEHPNVKIVYNADSSGTLLTQIEEGYECDLFFSAAQKQMDQLEADGLVVEGTRHNVVNNQVVVITLKDSDTAVTGLSRAPSLLRSTAALQRPLPFAAFPTVSALSVSSPSTAPSLRRSPLSARARSAAPSCSICVVVPARLLRSRAIFDDPRVKPGEKGQLVVPFFFIPGQTRL